MSTFTWEQLLVRIILHEKDLSLKVGKIARKSLKLLNFHRGMENKMNCQKFQALWKPVWKWQNFLTSSEERSVLFRVTS